MTAKEILIRARARIADESNWTQKALALDAQGEDIESSNPLAVRWCAVGAILAETGAIDKPYFEMRDQLWEAAKVINPFCDSIASFNDNNDHATVLKMFDAAIATL